MVRSAVHMLVILVFVLIPGMLFAQGRWDPPGADLTFPRTLLDSLEVPFVRSTLADPEILSLYGSVWSNAHSPVPPGNTGSDDRIARAMIAKEAAFVVLMDREYNAGVIDPLPAAERDTLVNKSVGLLESLNSAVGYQSGLSFYQEWQHRSKELITYLIAFDLLRGAGIPEEQLKPAEDSLLAFTAHLYQRAMATYTVYFLQLHFFTYQVNNHSIMTASALGLAALIFNSHEDTDPNYQPANWINAGLWNLDNTLWMENGSYPRVSEPDSLAGYAEGPNYFEYAFQNAFPFIRSMGNFLPDDSVAVTFNGVARNINNPWFDPRYDRLYDWMNRIRMPDGSSPPIHDSRNGFGTVITALSGNPAYNLANPGYSANDPFIRTQYIAAHMSHGAIQDSLFQALPQAGSLVFRSSWDTGAVYMHVIGKHGIALSGAKSHHQGDATSFILFAYGQLLADDAGYAGASLGSAVENATNHNLVLVNGYGPQPPTGEFVSTQTNTCHIENFFHTPLLDYGEVRTSYLGSDIIRKTLFVRSSCFFMTDFITSPLVNNYTFQLHGNGSYGHLPTDPEGAFLPDTIHGKCYYIRDSVHLVAQVLTPEGPGRFSLLPDSLAVSGDVFRHTTKFLVSRNNTDSALFLTTLYPYLGTEPDLSAVYPSGKTIATHLSDSGHHDLIFASLTGAETTLPSDSSGLSGSVTGNGKINFVSEESDGTFSTAFIQSGTNLTLGGQNFIRTDRPLDVASENSGNNYISGFVSDSGVVELYTPVEVHIISGNVSSFENHPAGKTVQINFSGKCNFQLAPGLDINEGKVPDRGISVIAYPNPSCNGLYNLTIFTDREGMAAISVNDLSGRNLSCSDVWLRKGISQCNLDLAAKPAGCYILSIRQSPRIAEIRLIKTGEKK
jgi:hypothetical protein